MQYLLSVNEFNKHMSFIASNSSAGAQGKELRPAGQIPTNMSNQEYMRHLSNAFNDPGILFKKMKRKQKDKKKSKLFKENKILKAI